MAVGIKTSELVLDETNLLLNEDILARTELGLVRVPKRAVPGMSYKRETIAGNTVTIINEAEHLGAFISLNPTLGSIELRVPDGDTILADIENNTFGGLVFAARVVNADNPVSIVSEVAGDLRGVGAGNTPIVADTLFAGLTAGLADEAIIRLYKSSSQLWTAECTTGWRTAVDGDGLRNIDITAVQNRVITDADHARPVWLTNAAPGTLTFQADIAVGTQTTVINQGSNAATFDFGTHTQLGDNTVAAGQAASIIVGPTVSGTDRQIFIAASS